MLKFWSNINAYLLYSVISFFITTPFYGQDANDCINAIPICGNTNNYVLNYNGPGNDDFALNPIPDCAPEVPVEHASIWLSISFDSSGSFEFDLDNSNNADNLNFVIFGPNIS